MHHINHTLFLDAYAKSLVLPKLNSATTMGVNQLLSFIEADPCINDLRWGAYLLATALWETGHTYFPIAEYGRGDGHPYGKPAANGQIYYGRGYVQLTWEDNYKLMSQLLGVNLLDDPDLALVPEHAYKIMSIGMRCGDFTGVNLHRFIDDDSCDYVNARRIINGRDQAERIAGYAVSIHDALYGAVI